MKTYYPAPFAIFKRGNPDGMTLDRKICEVVHSYIPPIGIHTDKALCRNGAYNCWFTNRKQSVTCPACLSELNKWL